MMEVQKTELHSLEEIAKEELSKEEIAELEADAAWEAYEWAFKPLAKG